MKAEIIGVGSELLLGQIANTNAQFISARLAEVGIDVYYHTVVGDNPTRLQEVVRQAQSRADLLIFTGGLGPTKDDMTKETIASMINASLTSNDDALQHIESYFQRLGRPMTANNRKQALVIEGSTVLKNKTGMAPGMAVTDAEHTYILLPGPPHEMKPMVTDEVIPYLLGVEKNNEVIVSRTLNLYGIGEAEIETRIEHLLENQTNPTIAPLANLRVVNLRLTAKAKTEEEAYRLIAPVEEEIREELGEYIFGVDRETLPSKALEMMKEHKLTISAAESLTAGLFMSELAAESGASAVLKGGAVVYDIQAKSEQLGIDYEWLERVGVVSEQCAHALAESVREKFHSDIGVGLTGAAGPDPHDGKPAGTIYIGIACPKKTNVYELNLSDQRNVNRERAAHFALYYLIRHLREL